jgi:hypothetical protein
MKIVATLCSASKSHTEGKLPAFERYTSMRIKNVMKVAKGKQLPFFIFSGKYGLIPYDYPIPYYDHLLSKDEVGDMAVLLSDQIKGSAMSSIDFYIHPDDSAWNVYREALKEAATTVGVILNEHSI